jgi:hypothetical protein
MPRPFLRARATLLTALIGMFMAPAQAADLFSLPEAPALPEEPVEWGSNWYLRGDIGWQQIKVPALSGDFTSSLNNADLAMGAIGGGYQFNEMASGGRHGGPQRVSQERDHRPALVSLSDGGAYRSVNRPYGRHLR